jgi:hypothetical protein
VYDGPINGADQALAIALSDSGVVITGGSEGSHYDYATIKYVQTSGIEEIVQQHHSDFSLLQNPVMQEIEVRCPFTKNENIVVNLYDISGRFVRTLFTGKSKDRLKLSVDGISSGTYFLSIRIDGGQEVKKVVVIK